MGIGRTLLAHVESKAAQLKLGEIRLQTNEAFEANITLYTVLGYKIDRREPFKGGTTVFSLLYTFQPQISPISRK